MNPRDSRIPRWIAGGLLPLSLLLGVTPGPTMAREPEPCTMEVLVDGVPVPEYVARGTTYVEARAGREYSIRLRNRTAGRVAVALSVDGLNSIDARISTARDGSKWILGPYETITLDGWQTSSATARRFYFTTERDSYGAWLGETRNLGILSAAVFREKIRPPHPISRPELEKEGHNPLGDRPEAAPESSMGRGSNRQENSSDAAGSQLRAGERLSDDLAATGIGRQVDHRVRRVPFEAESAPAQVLNIRYEYRDALVRLGVLPPEYEPREDPLARRERARGFEDTGFAPDPFRP